MSDKNHATGFEHQIYSPSIETKTAPFAGALTHEEKERRSRIVMRSRVDLLEAGLLAGPYGQQIDRQWINGEITLAERRAALHAQYFSGVTDTAA